MLNKLYNSIFFKPLYYLLRILFQVKEYFIRYNFKKALNPTLSLETIRNYNKNRTKGPVKLICNAPFKHMYFKQNGKVTACCATSVDAYGNINEDSISNIWNGKNANELRNRIENYNLSGGCSGCQYSLETKNYNAFIGRIYDELLLQKKQSYPTEMTFEISNTCNLECIMCNGEFSNLIRKNIEKLPEIPNYYNEEFFDELKEFLPHLKRVRFMGGEPFLIKQYAPIMEYLIEHNPSCKINIQTNGTILNNSVKKIIESKNVEISISLDSLQKETYEIIRKNANFDTMMKNLDYFSKRAIENKQLININFCIMNNNWKEVPDIIFFCEKNNFTLNLIPVEKPRHLSLRISNVADLEAVYIYSKNNLSKIKNVILKEKFNGYLNHLFSLIQTAKKDKIRRKELLLMTEEELYVKSESLFNLLNNIDKDGKEKNAFDISCHIFDDLLPEKKRNIFADIIVDMEKVDVNSIKHNNKTYNEILSDSRIIFEQMKA